MIIIESSKVPIENVTIWLRKIYKNPIKKNYLKAKRRLK
jgi:hypothetical protein